MQFIGLDPARRCRRSRPPYRCDSNGIASAKLWHDRIDGDDQAWLIVENIFKRAERRDGDGVWGSGGSLKVAASQALSVAVQGHPVRPRARRPDVAALDAVLDEDWLCWTDHREPGYRWRATQMTIDGSPVAAFARTEAGCWCLIAEAPSAFLACTGHGLPAVGIELTGVDTATYRAVPL